MHGAGWKMGEFESELRQSAGGFRLRICPESAANLQLNAAESVPLQRLDLLVDSECRSCRAMSQHFCSWDFQGTIALFEISTTEGKTSMFCSR